MTIIEYRILILIINILISSLITNYVLSHINKSELNNFHMTLNKNNIFGAYCFCRLAQDGRLKSVTVHGFQKRYDLEKYYTFILKVTRQNQPDPAYLFRSYKEFSEFHQKLCLHYPLAKLHR